MANYDEVVKRNKDYLTQAQINALAAASQEYNIANAGNRAGALASAREQYDTAYRGLQNMGLAGNPNAAPASGEVPRLQMQIKTPFDSYNERLKQVENQRLGALGEQFKQDTIAQREAEEAARRAQEEARRAQEEARRRAQLQAAAQTLQSKALKIGTTVMKGVANKLMGISSTKKENPAAVAAATKAQVDGLKRTQQVQQQTVNAAVKAQIDGMNRTARPQDVAAAAAFNIAHYSQKPAVTAANAAQERGMKLTEQYKGAADTSKANQYYVDANQKAFTKEQAEVEYKEAQNNLTNLQQKRHGGGAVSEDEYKAAVYQRDAAKLKAENPKLYQSFAIIENPYADAKSREEAGNEIMRAYGYTNDERTAEQYTADKKKAAQYSSYLATFDDKNASAEEKKAAENMLKNMGVTPDQAREFISKHRQARAGQGEYSYYKNAILNSLTYAGKTPSRGVNKDETDPLYRAVNKLNAEKGDDYNLMYSELAALPDDVTTGEEYVGNELRYITEDERNAYNYIYETEGLAAANQYIRDGLPLRNVRAAIDDEAYAKQLVENSPVAANFLSIAAGTFGNVPAMIEKLVKGTYNFVAQPQTPLFIDTNDDRLANMSNLIQSATSQKILESNPGTSGKIYNFAYQTGMSMAQSAVAMTFAAAGAPWAVDVMFFSSAGNEAYKDAIERGATQEQALASGVLSGVAEALFEHASIEHFMNLDYQGKGRLIKNMLSQAGAEASEEINTELANILTDAWVMRDKSNYNLAVQQYMSEGMDKDVAENKAFMDQLGNVGMAGLGGLVSGLGFGVFGALPNAVSQVKTGKEAKASKVVDQYVRNAALLGGDAQRLAQEVNDAYGVKKTKSGSIETEKVAGREKMKTTEPSNRLVGALVQQVNKQVQELAQSAESGAAVQALLTGEKLTTNGAKAVMDQLGADTVKEMGYDTSSPSAFAKSFNARLQENSITPRMQEVGKYRQAAYGMAERRNSPIEYQEKYRAFTAEDRANAAVTAARANASNRVWANPTQGMAMTTPDGTKVTPMPGNMRAVEQAEQERTNFKARSTATKGNVTYAVAGMEAREGLSNEQTYSEIQKGLTKEARQKAQLYEKLASALGVKMVIHDVMTGTNGFIDEDGNVHVVLSGRQSVLRVAAHELTHYMKDNAKVEYSALRSHLIAEVGNDKFDRMVNRKASEYGIDLSTEKGKVIADDEVCAELCERMLSNEEALEKFAEKDTAAAKTLKEHLLKILNAIKSAFKRAENRDFGESWSDLIRQQDTIESWITGLQKAIDNANARSNTVEGQIAKTAGVTTADQNAVIDEINQVAKELEKKVAEANTEEKQTETKQAEASKEEAKQETKASKEQAPAKAEKEETKEQESPANTEKEETKEQESPAKQLQVKEAKPAAKKQRPRKYVSVIATEKNSQGTTFEGGRVPRGMSDISYKIKKASKFASGHVSGTMSDYATFGYSSYSGSLDGDAYGYSKVTWRNTNGRAIADMQSAVSSAADLKQGDAFIDDVVRMDFLTSEELGHASSMEESSVVGRDPADVSTDVLSNAQMKAASSVADMLANGNDVVLQLPVSENFDQLSRATLKAVFEAMPADKRTGISFATGLTSADISRYGGDVSLIITDKSQQQTGDGKLWIDMTGNAAKNAAQAEYDAAVDQIIAEHSVDVIEYDMAGYRADLEQKGLMSKGELDELFTTMKNAVKYVKEHRAILDFGEELNTEEDIVAAKQNRAYLPYKQNADPHYKLALDFSTLCKKRILLQMIQERLQGKLKRSLSALETIAIRREILKLQKNGVDVEVACALCYVEAARMKSHKVIDEFLGVGMTKAGRAANVEAEMRNYFAQKDKDIKKVIDKDLAKWKEDKLGKDWTGFTKSGKKVGAANASKDHLKAFGGQKLVDEYNAFAKGTRSKAKVNDAQEEIIKEAKRLVQETPEAFLSAESLAKMKKSNPDIFYAFVNKVRSATRSKALETDTFYSRGDIDMVDEAIIRAANQESGFRHQSWSDFMPIHLLDTMASVIEMSQRDAKMHAYTKVPAMVELLGNTGMMLNMSLIPKGEFGIDKDGNLIFDSVEGMDWDTMMNLRDLYPNTAGNIAIGISDEQIKKLLDSRDIDYVIPYHASGMNQTLRTHMNIEHWVEYTKTQNEVEKDGYAPDGKTWKEKHKKGKMKPPALARWFDADEARGEDGYAYMQKASEKYIDICNKEGWIPKFPQYLTKDADGNYHLNDEYKNYWKMLTDRKMVNQITGGIIEQKSVKPIFDNMTVMSILKGEAENPTAIRNAAAADEIAGELAKTWRADRENANLKSYKAELNAFREASAVMAADRVKEDVKRRLAETRNSIDTDYMRLAEKYRDGSISPSDMIKMRWDVNEMARLFGYTELLYHGTDNFGFTAIDANESDDHISFFATDSIPLARSYARNKQVRDVSTRSIDGSKESGIYQLYANTDNFLEVDAGGKTWKSIPVPETMRTDIKGVLDDLDYRYGTDYAFNGATITTRALAAYAKAAGFDGVKISNVVDFGKHYDGSDRGQGTVYTFLHPAQQVKSADLVTVDSDNDIIPLVDRFDASTPDIRYSIDTDSEGRELSSQQQEYFKDSSVRDDNGKLLVLYHGTTHFGEITQFRKGKSGWLGPGIYLTSRKADAQRYANAMGEGNGTVYELYANAKNPLVVSSTDPAQDILRAIYGTDTVFQRRSANQGNATSILTAADIKKLQSKGYDGIRWNYANSTEVSVFSPEQVKRTDNTSPTASKDIRYDLDTDAIRQAFTVIDTAGIEDGLEALKDVKHVGSFALKDISRFLDASAGKNKDLRNTLHAIFEAPHSEATGRYARGVERMQQKVLDIGKRAGVCDEKGKHFDSKKSAAIQNIGEGFSNTYTDLKLKVKDADHVTVKAYEPGTDNLVDSEKDYTLKELRQAYGTNAADYVWSRVFDETQKAQDTGGKPGWVDEKVNTRPYTIDDLQTAYPNDWQKLKAAADEFRQMYDEYIRDQNNMLATIYPIESEYADVEKLDAGIEKKQERLAQHKAAVNTQIENLQKSLEAKEKEIASKKRTDTKAYRQLVEQANKLTDKIAEVKAEIAEYEANVKDELVKMNTLKAEMQNAVKKGDYSLKRMHRLQYRSDYFHHFTEMASGIQNLKSIFTNNTDIAPAIVGKSEGTKAKTRWAGYFQQRMGGDYTADALNGMLRYGQLAEYKLAFDPLTAYLRDVNKQIRNLSSDTNRDGLIRYIDQWADTIAGKSHKLDRVVSDAGMAPRKAMQVLQWINSRVIQNTLLFNMRSALVQISNITNAKGIVKNNIDWVNGLKAWALAAKGDEAMASIMAQSNFLASRYMDGLALTDSKLKSAKQFAGWMLGALDEVSAKATWWAAYQQYTRNPNAAKNQYRNYDSAVDYADDITRRTHAGRGVGELAPAMTSRVINFVAPFQVEVNNTWQLLKDNVKQKNYLGLLSTGLSVFLFNTAFEAIVGSTPLGFDFIRAVVDIALGFLNDDPDDDPDAKEIAQRFAGELVGGLPFASQLVAAFGEDNAKKVLGENNDATRYGNTQIGVNAVVNAVKGLKDIGTGLIEGRRVNWIDDLDDLMNLTLPMGAKQLTRTAQGLATVAKGYGGKYDKEGNEKVQFVTDQDVLHYIHAGLFGKWALTEASEYFGEKRLLPELFGAYNGKKSSIGTMVDAKEYKAALDTGIDGKDYFTLKYDLKSYTTQAGKRAEMMEQSFTPEQKAKLDALMLGGKDAEMKAEGAVVYQKSSDGEWKVKADYSNQDMFDLSTNGDKIYTGTIDAMEKTGLPQDQAALAANMWEQAKAADDSKQAFRDLLRDNKNLTVEQKEALDKQYCGNKYAADYSDPDLYELSTTNRTLYDKAKAAKSQGIPVKQYVSLNEKKNAYTGEDKADYLRREVMNTNLTAKQKEALDDILISDKDRYIDYSSKAWFEISMLGKGQYTEAKEGTKVGLKPETYLTVYKKWKTLDAKDENGNTRNGLKKKRAKEYLDSLPLSGPEYSYIWTAVFGYK